MSCIVCKFAGCPPGTFPPKTLDLSDLASDQLKDIFQSLHESVWPSLGPPPTFLPTHDTLDLFNPAADQWREITFSQISQSPGGHPRSPGVSDGFWCLAAEAVSIRHSGRFRQGVGVTPGRRRYMTAFGAWRPWLSPFDIPVDFVKAWGSSPVAGGLGRLLVPGGHGLLHSTFRSISSRCRGHPRSPGVSDGFWCLVAMAVSIRHSRRFRQGVRVTPGRRGVSDGFWCLAAVAVSIPVDFVKVSGSPPGAGGCRTAFGAWRPRLSQFRSISSMCRGHPRVAGGVGRLLAMAVSIRRSGRFRQGVGEKGGVWAGRVPATLFPQM